MPENSATFFRVDRDQIRGLIDAYTRAANSILDIVSDVGQKCRLDEPWAHDDVSSHIAEFYNDQVSTGNYCTYAVLSQYESELRAVVRTLEQMLANYHRADAEAAASLKLP